MKTSNHITYLKSTLLAIIGILSFSNTTITAQDNTDIIRVGVFNGNGASPVCVIETIEALKIDIGIEPISLSAADIMNNKLDSLDALIFPGGSGSKEFNMIGQLAADKIKEFGQRKDKGLIGICAGGYLMASTPTYPNLDILEVAHTRKHYDRGRGLIGFSLNKKGKEIFFELEKNDSLYVQYYDGPIFKENKLNKLNILGTINTDIVTKKGYPHDFTPGKPCFFTKDYGEGKIFVSVGHPEATAGMRWMVPRMVRWTVHKDLVSYPEITVRPNINSKEVLFYKDTKKTESRLFWKLSDKDPTVIIDALDSLHAIRSRPSIRWSIGLLRHKDWNVRFEAAKYLLESEYTYAIPDIEAAVSYETTADQKSKIQEILNSIKSIVRKEKILN